MREVLRSTTLRRLRFALGVVTLLLGGYACGDDESGTEVTTTTATTTNTSTTTSTTSTEPTCGNGQLEEGEVCDGAEFGDASCRSLDLGRGTLVCASGCGELDTTGCHPGATRVILFVGDGMGFEQVKAGGLFDSDSEGSLFIESLPEHGTVATASADGSVTDSAAAATAMATGVKVDNGVLSVADPGDGSELTTALEIARDSGWRTGLVTTSILTDATPAAFGAHELSRTAFADIAQDYLEGSRPDVLFGGTPHIDAAMATGAGYDLVSTAVELAAIDPGSVTKLFGLFGDTYSPYVFDGLGGLPSLGEMTHAALSVLELEPEGFFLMVEGGRIDHACHDNDAERMVHEIVAFDDAVEIAYNWAQDVDDVLIIVTADHETGGMTVISGNGQGVVPSVSFTSGSHTGAEVPIYAWGLGSEAVAADLENTDIFEVIVN